MLAHKLVPKYMEQLELKYDSPSYKKDKNKCLASGERAMLSYNRVVNSVPMLRKPNPAHAIMFYTMRYEKEALPPIAVPSAPRPVLSGPASSAARSSDWRVPPAPAPLPGPLIYDIKARRQHRKKETSI